MNKRRPIAASTIRYYPPPPWNGPYPQRVFAADGVLYQAQGPFNLRKVSVYDWAKGTYVYTAKQVSGFPVRMRWR